MTILSKEIFTNHGPYIQFADRADRIDENRFGSQNRISLAPFVFFQLSINLLESYSSITNGFSPIDPYETVQLHEPHEIKDLASEVLLWVIQLLRTKHSVFRKEVLDYSFYEGSLRFDLKGELTGEHLRLDLIETLLFLAGRFSRIACAKRCLVIAGV